MRLQFDKSGRRFFFLTFCVMGRKAVLSRIVEKAERDGRPGYAVELTPAGEAMAALWRGIHARWPFLTASNFIVMPDHLHLLLIVDYRQAKGIRKRAASRSAPFQPSARYPADAARPSSCASAARGT